MDMPLSMGEISRTLNCDITTKRGDIYFYKRRSHISKRPFLGRGKKSWFLKFQPIFAFLPKYKFCPYFPEDKKNEIHTQHSENNKMKVVKFLGTAVNPTFRGTSLLICVVENLCNSFKEF